jgi:hypothetical protein
MSDPFTSAMNRLAKWRSVFASWQLGTRTKADPECQAVSEHREATILLRVELSTLEQLLIKKGIITSAEFEAQAIEEAGHLHRAYCLLFPGFEATEDGINIDTRRAKATMEKWPK